MNTHDASADPGVAKSLRHHQESRAMQMLLGIVTGMVADDHLHDREIQYLSTWLSENQAATTRWPGSVVCVKVREILADGVITEAERQHLLDVLQKLVGVDFGDTGSAQAEVAGLPIDDDVTVEMTHAGVCHTGTFMFGTRAAVERMTLKAGGMPLDSVTKKTDLLVVGAMVSTDWAHTSFGRKIQRAAELQQSGHPIEIISEKRWMQVVARP